MLTSRNLLIRASIAATAAWMLIAPPALAREKTILGPVRLLNTIPVPVAASNKTGGMYSWDISWFDVVTHRYYLADRSNAVIDVLDDRTQSFVQQITANFTGFNGSTSKSGPNGVVVAYPYLFATDANSRVVAIDVRTNQTVGSVSTGGAAGLRADELAIDGTGRYLLVVNNADDPPFATIINVNMATGALSVGKRLTFDGKQVGFKATNGAEQPQWEPITKKFYLSIPEVNGVTNTGGVARIDPSSGAVEALYPVYNCSPAGLAVGPRAQFLVGCNTVFDTAGNVWSSTGKTTAAPKVVLMDARTGMNWEDIPGIGAGDEVWYNPGDNMFYVAASSSPLAPSVVVPGATLTAQGAAILGVIDSNGSVQRLPTLNVPAVTGTNAHPAGTAHSVAVSPFTNHAYVPLAANNVYPNCLTGCIAVYGRGTPEIPEAE